MSGRRVIAGRIERPISPETMAAYQRDIERAWRSARTYQFSLCPGPVMTYQCQGPVMPLETGDLVAIGGASLRITAMEVDEHGVCNVTAEECFDGYTRVEATESDTPQSHADWIEANAK